MPAHVSFADAMDGDLQVSAGVPQSSQLVADGGQSTVLAKGKSIALVTATSDVYVLFGPNPTASADKGFYMPSGSFRAFGRLKDGDKMSVTAV